jgi:hypothetical protein
VGLAGRPGRRRRGAGEANRSGRCHRGERAAPGGARGRGRGRHRGRAQEGEGGPTRTENKEHEETVGTTMMEAHRRRRPSPEPSTKSSIGDEPLVGSTNRRHRDEVSTRRTQRHLRILSTTHISKVISRWSCHRSWNHLQTSASDLGSFGSNLRVGFQILKRDQREDLSHIHIARV